MKESRPKTGDPFKCPICEQHFIAGITAEIVADYNRAGNLRGFLCADCKDGLERLTDGGNHLQNALKHVQGKHTLE